MEYLKLKVHSEERGPVYEKDFRVNDLFGGFVRTKVANLIDIGFFREGQLYWATITPRYGEIPASEVALVLESVPDEQVAASSERRWLSLAPDTADHPEEPMSHFRLELHTMPPGARVYGRDFQLSTLDGPIRRVQETLQQMELIRQDEPVRTELYVRSGTPDLEKEKIHSLPGLLSDVEIKVEAMPERDAYPEKAMPECVACGRTGEEPSGGLVIFLRRECLALLQDHVRRHGSREVESGGILIGEVYQQPRVPRLFVEIEDFLPAEETRASSVSLRFTHETWQRLQARKRERFGDGKRIVGWYHTHPPVELKVEGQRTSTVQFFSTEDLSVHRQIFSKPWQVALVMDAASDEKIFFRWEGASVVESGFHQYEP
jgi:proteasome lid subunit RPN8/RPN11